MSRATPLKLGPLGRHKLVFAIIFTALLGLLADPQNDSQFSAPLVVETPSIGRVKVSARRTGTLVGETRFESHRGRVLHVEKFELEPPDSRAAAGKLQGVMFREFRPHGFPNALLLTVGYQTFADRIEEEVALIASIRGKLLTRSALAELRISLSS